MCPNVAQALTHWVAQHEGIDAQTRVQQAGSLHPGVK
jgi:hypothetical protein